MVPLLALATGSTGPTYIDVAVVWPLIISVFSLCPGCVVGVCLHLCAPGVPQVHSIQVGGICALAKAYHEEQQHTEPRTGLLLWDSGKALAALLLAYSGLTAGAGVPMQPL